MSDRTQWTNSKITLYQQRTMPHNRKLPDTTTITDNIYRINIGQYI